MALVIIVELYAKDTAAAIDTLKRTLVEATGIYTKDQGTLEWRPIQDTADKRAFRVFEKFESQAVRSNLATRIIHCFADSCDREGLPSPSGEPIPAKLPRRTQRCFR